MIAELTKINPLPGAQVEPAFGNGDGHGRADHRGFDVGGHIVGALDGVGEKGEVFRHNVIENTFEVRTHIRIRILIDGEGGGGMLDKQVEHAAVGQGTLQLPLHFSSDDVVTPLESREGEFVLLYHAVKFYRTSPPIRRISSVSVFLRLKTALSLCWEALM